MTGRTLIVRRAAELDLHEAAAWYDRQRAGLGSELLVEVREMLETIQSRPGILSHCISPSPSCPPKKVSVCDLFPVERRLHLGHRNPACQPGPRSTPPHSGLIVSGISRIEYCVLLLYQSRPVFPTFPTLAATSTLLYSARLVRPCSCTARRQRKCRSVRCDASVR